MFLFFSILCSYYCILTSEFWSQYSVVDVLFQIICSGCYVLLSVFSCYVLLAMVQLLCSFVMFCLLWFICYVLLFVFSCYVLLAVVHLLCSVVCVQLLCSVGYGSFVMFRLHVRQLYSIGQLYDLSINVMNLWVQIIYHSTIYSSL